MDGRYFSDKIVKWYLGNKRSLPWRDTRDPYKIWLSEIILQQTRVAQGLPYFEKFVSQYPNVAALANAPLQEVLRLWQGLGYYTRARNLHRCAKTIVEIHKGEFPRTHHALLSLPGIGEYTAAAIASFAFDEPVAVVDGNVFRILSRIFGIDTPINTPEGKKTFTARAQALLSVADPALHNQAVMEFGALFCTPVNPRCADCGFNRTCFAYQKGLVDALPYKIPKKTSRTRYFYYLVIQRKKSLLMKRRDGRDIWHGLFDFPLVEREKPARTATVLAAAGIEGIRLNDISVSQEYCHKLTHQTIYCRFLTVKVAAGFRWPDKGLSFYTLRQIGELPKPALISRFLQDQNTR